MVIKPLKMFFINKYLFFLRYLASDRYQKSAILYAADRYDMCTEPSEDYYAGIYLQFIRDDISTVFGRGQLKILDVGCGSGRISLPLAQEGYQITGIDISAVSIEKARQYAKERDIKIDFRVFDITTEKGDILGNDFDCVICTEMIYMIKNPENLIREFLKLIRLYYILHSIMQGSWSDAEKIAKNYSGFLGGIKFNWITIEKIVEMYSTMGIAPKKFRAIGPCSGIEGDPQSCISIPAELNEHERAQLRTIEINIAEIYPESGRYLYVAASVERISEVKNEADKNI